MRLQMLMDKVVHCFSKSLQMRPLLDGVHVDEVPSANMSATCSAFFPGRLFAFAGLLHILILLLVRNLLFAVIPVWLATPG